MENLVLLHGALGGEDQLYPLKDKLKNHFNIHLLEFKGHGKKASISQPFYLDDLVGQLNEAIQEIEQAHVFGYSMGGFVALAAAAVRDDLIQSITTLGTKMNWSPEIASKEMKFLNPEKIKDKVPDFFQSLMKRHGEHWIEVLHRTSEFMKSLGLQNPLQPHRLQKVNCPVQLLLADNDQMVTEAETKSVLKSLSNAEFHRLENSEHPIEKVDLNLLPNRIIEFIKKEVQRPL